MTEEFSGLAGLFQKALEDPATQGLATIYIQLLMLEQEVLDELEGLGLPASVLEAGFQDPAYEHWITAPGGNKAARERSFDVIFFGQQLRQAQGALSNADYLAALSTLSGFISPPFRLRDKPGGRKAKITPRLAQIVQLSAEGVWRDNPRLSVKRVAELIQPGWAKIFEGNRWGDPPSVRTLRAYITKPGGANGQEEK